jgi:SAM-dependent methyltransferase
MILMADASIPTRNIQSSSADRAMTIASEILNNYQRGPYPTVDCHSSRRAKWVLPPMEWIIAVWQPAQPVPQRILVAGCGTGNEAFALRDRFPDSEIVGIDFSSHSIKLAKKSQRNRRSQKNIHFAVCDLTSSKFTEIGKFDFISCHGVLSYVPQAVKALRNIRRCLDRNGVFYVGVNGAGHYATAWRQVLPSFGIAINRISDGARLRKTLALLDTLSESDICSIARQEPVYLSGDLFGPLIRNLPLRDWSEICEQAGLHLLASHAASRGFHSVINKGIFHLLMPRSRADLAQMLDILQPASFHRLLFANRRRATPPWSNGNELLEWRPLLASHLRNRRWPRHHGQWETLRHLKIKMAATNTLIELRVAEWLLEILRNSQGLLSLRQILRVVESRFNCALLQRQLYLLHHLDVLSLEEPALAE